MSRSLDQRQVRITAPQLGTVTLPWWPDEIAWSGMAATYDEQERPGRRPLLLRQGIGLEELRVGTVVRTRDIEGVGGLEATSISDTLTKLREMSRAVKPLTVNLAGRSGQYRITDLGITELEWNADGYPLVAEISLTLLESSEAAVPVGPIRRPEKPSRPPRGGRGSGETLVRVE